VEAELSEPCGRDAVGNELEQGDFVLCLCCSSHSYADQLDPYWGGLDSYEFEGSQWVSVRWLVSHD
jgi:hypothetical protein